jgi:hypothetical protein
MPSAPSNQELIETHAKPGMIGLAGGSALIDRAIRKVQRKISDTRSASHWSHAFIFSEKRVDGHQWVLESDLEIHHKQIRLGVQENRSQKYWSAEAYPNLAILDFGLSPENARTVLTAAMDLLSGLSRYSIRELMGTLLAIQKPTLRTRENLMAREGALYCSAFVQHCYLAANLDFAPGVDTKNTTPEDISNTLIPHQTYAIIRAK